MKSRAAQPVEIVGTAYNEQSSGVAPNRHQRRASRALKPRSERKRTRRRYVDIQTKKLFQGDHCSAEAQLDGKPLGRPIHFKWGTTGWYITIDIAEAIAVELAAAVAAARKAEQP